MNVCVVFEGIYEVCFRIINKQVLGSVSLQRGKLQVLFVLELQRLVFVDGVCNLLVIYL